MSPEAEVRENIDALLSAVETVEVLGAALQQFREILADMGPEAAEVA